jgi:predicted Zn-dependent protease
VFPIPPAFQRLADQVDGWLDLRCPDRALALLEPLLAEPMARAAGLAMRIRAQAALGKYREALPDLAELRLAAPAEQWVDITEAWCRKRVGDLPGSIRCLERLVERDHHSDIGYFNLACYLALAGERDRAIDALSLACGLSEDCRDFARDDPDLDSLRTDPRFRQLLREEPAATAGNEAPAVDYDDDDDDDGGEPPGPHDRHRRN